MTEQFSGFRTMLRSTGIYGIGIALQRAVSILMLPVYTRYLTPADYGTLELLDVVMAAFGLALGVRVAAGLGYFCSQPEYENRRATVVSTLLIGSAAIGIIAGAIGILLAPMLSTVVFGTYAYARYLRIMFVAFACELPLECALHWLRVQDRPLAYVCATCGQLLLALLFNLVFLVGFHLGLEALLWSNLISMTAGSLVGSIVVIRRTGIGFDWRLFVQVCRFSVSIGLVGLSSLVFHVSDRIFLQRAVGTAGIGLIGLYGLAYKLGMSVSFVQQAFNMYWGARVYEIVRGTEGRELFSRIFTYYLLILSTVGLAVWLFASPLVRVLTAPPYHAASAFVPWVVGAYFLRSAADYLRSSLYVQGVPRYDAFLNVGCASICLALNAWLIPQYGVWGALWSTLATFAALLAGAYVIALRVYAVQLERARLFKMGAALVAIVSLFQMLDIRELLPQVIIAAVLLLAYPALLVCLRFFGRSELQAVLVLLRRWNILPNRNTAQVSIR